VYGNIKTKQGQNEKKLFKMITSIEQKFIAFAKLNGHDLVNKQGARTPFHEITNSGNLDIRQILSYKMNIKAE
jgi:hypothetical protein